MSLFVLIYDRGSQQSLELCEFATRDRDAADAFRMNAQLRAFRENLDQEIVLFEATSRESLQRTHGSYFLSEEELRARMREAVEAT